MISHKGRLGNYKRKVWMGIVLIAHVWMICEAYAIEQHPSMKLVDGCWVLHNVGECFDPFAKKHLSLHVVRMFTNRCLG